MQRFRTSLIAVSVSGLLAISACSSDGESTGSSEGSDPQAAPTSASISESESATASSDSSGLGYADVELLETSERTRGPNGEQPVSSSELELTDEQIEELSGMDLTAAALWQASFQFQDANNQGIQSVFDEVGAELIATTDAQYDPAQQANDVESIMAQEPEMLFTWVIDSVQGAAAFRPAVDSGVQLALLSNLPEGYEHPEDYVGIVTDDLFGMGEAAAHAMADSLGGEGQVAWIFHDADAYVTNQRDNAFKETIESEYPDIEIVAEEGFSEPAQALEITESILLRNPDVNGIYAAWAEPAASVVEALRAQNREDVAVVTLDLDPTVAVDMAQGGNVKAIIADTPVEIGRALAVEALLGVLGEETPPFAVVPSMVATQENLATAWNESLQADPPQEVLDALSNAS